MGTNKFTKIIPVLLSFPLTIIPLSHLHSAILVEPFLGYMVKTGAEEELSGVNREYDHHGPNYGAKLGLSYFGLQGGLEYNHSTYDMKLDSPQGQIDAWNTARKGLKDDMSANYWGIFLGYKFPVLLRVWATYHFSATLEDSNTNSGNFDSGDELNGSGTTIGVGYTGLPFINLNLEYRKTTLDEFDDASNGRTISLPDSTADKGEYTLNEFLLSVSLPINL